MLFKRLYYELRALADISFFFCVILLLLISILTHLGTMKEATGFIENYVALTAIIIFSNVFFSRQRQNVVEIEAQFQYSIRGKIYRSTFIMILLFFFIIFSTYIIFAFQTEDNGISLFLYLFNMYSVVIFFGSFTLFVFSLTKSLGIALISSIIIWSLNSSLNSLIPHEYKIFNAYLGEQWWKVKLIYLLGGIVLSIINQSVYNKRFQYVLNK